MMKKIFSIMSLLTALIAIFSVNAFAIRAPYPKHKTMLEKLISSDFSLMLILILIIAITFGIIMYKNYKLKKNNPELSIETMIYSKNITRISRWFYILLSWTAIHVFLAELPEYSVYTLGIFIISFVVFYFKNITKKTNNEEITQEEKSLNKWISIVAYLIYFLLLIFAGIICLFFWYFAATDYMYYRNLTYLKIIEVIAFLITLYPLVKKEILVAIISISLLIPSLININYLLYPNFINML